MGFPVCGPFQKAHALGVIFTMPLFVVVVGPLLQGQLTKGPWKIFQSSSTVNNHELDFVAKVSGADGRPSIGACLHLVVQSRLAQTMEYVITPLAQVRLEPTWPS